MPTLANLIGLNESIVLQQIHYWLKNKERQQQDYIDGRYWVYNTYEKWQEQFPFWSIRTLKRIFTTLENSGLLLSANYNKTNFDKTKWYSIDYETLNVLSASCQNGTSIVPTCHHGTCQNDPTNTIDYTETTTKTNRFKALKGAELKQSHTITTPFDPAILEKQIIKSCRVHSVQDFEPFVDIISYYYNAYKRTFGKEHPRLSAKAMDSVINAFLNTSDSLECDPDTYHVMIDQHFMTQIRIVITISAILCLKMSGITAFMRHAIKSCCP